MKYILVIFLMLTAVVERGQSQYINWRALREGQHQLLQASFGYSYGFTSRLSYYSIVSKNRPASIGMDFSMPMGNELIDDFTLRFGGQIEIAEIDGFSTTIRISAIFRRYHSEMVRISNFGADAALISGYFAPTWSIGGEMGFDKSVISYFHHSTVMRSNYPAINDGWYAPVGGHLYYGIQGGKTIGESIDLSLRIGATKAQWNDDNAVIPLYAQLGLGTRF